MPRSPSLKKVYQLSNVNILKTNNGFRCIPQRSRNVFCRKSYRYYFYFFGVESGVYGYMVRVIGFFNKLMLKWASTNENLSLGVCE